MWCWCHPLVAPSHVVDACQSHRTLNGVKKISIDRIFLDLRDFHHLFCSGAPGSRVLPSSIHYRLQGSTMASFDAGSVVVAGYSHSTLELVPCSRACWLYPHPIDVFFCPAQPFPVKIPIYFVWLVALLIRNDAPPFKPELYTHHPKPFISCQRPNQHFWVHRALSATLTVWCSAPTSFWLCC